MTPGRAVRLQSQTQAGAQEARLHKKKKKKVPIVSLDVLRAHQAAWVFFFFWGGGIIAAISSHLKPVTFKTISTFIANIYQHKVMFGMVTISTW